jgi:hypothetical protein
VQFWDKNHLFAGQLALRMRSDPEHPQPHCCFNYGLHWDEVAVYREDAHWGDQLPRAVFLDGPVVHALGFANVVTELQQTKEKSQAVSAP